VLDTVQTSLDTFYAISAPASQSTTLGLAPSLRLSIQASQRRVYGTTQIRVDKREGVQGYGNAQFGNARQDLQSS